MALQTQPLRDEHKELLPQLEQLLVAADSLNGDAESSRRITAAYEFLAHHLIVHAAAEEAALYPVVAKVMGAPEATQTMERDHKEVRRLTDELAAFQQPNVLAQATSQQLNDLRRLLYGLYTLVKVHFAKEEEVYLPLLDERLTPAEASAMFQALESAAETARHSIEERSHGRHTG